MSGRQFTCEACGGTFDADWSEEEAWAEANAAFAPDELVDAARVCDDCWLAMRAAIPEMDRRYAPRHLRRLPLRVRVLVGPLRRAWVPVAEWLRVRRVGGR